MNSAKTLAAVAVLGVLAGSTWWLSRDTAAPLALRPDDAALVSRGERVYAEACAACHGARLQGQPDWRTRKPDGRLPAPPHDASGHTWHHPDAQLIILTRDGPAAVVGGAYESDMPAFRDSLSDADIIAALSYIKSQWPPAIRARHDELNQRAGSGG